jgi:hypothetical protein
LRKFIWAFVACPGLTASVFAASASVAAAGGCQRRAPNLSPGLNSSSQPFSYNFGGDLSGCQSSEAGSPASGTVGAGQTVVERVTNSIREPPTQSYQEPVPTGNGGCGSSTTSGSALVAWADGTYTVFNYSTTGALAAVVLTGSVAPSMTLTATNAQAGDPTTFTIATDRYSGDSTAGLWPSSRRIPRRAPPAGATIARLVAQSAAG